MKDEQLTRMANQIAGFFASYPEAEAIAGIGSHIEHFWEPRMRAQLLEHIEQGAEGLSPLVCAALRPGRAPTAE